MHDFEKLGVFYLGRPFDHESGKAKEGLLLYDSRDLVTHAVCIGMTGSGKTGLCIGLLEEAVLDGIPAIAIDPKGDIPNLLLTFPDLRPSDFAPWVNEDDARRKGLSREQYAEQQANTWREGLADWGLTGERIRRLREGAEFAVYTPGSNAGLQVSIMKSFCSPSRLVIDDSELFRDRISTTSTSLLSLLDIEADPLRSREHILISKIFESSWSGRRDLDLTGLIREIQTPPFTHVGALDLESFYPAKDRFALAMMLNNLLAAPGFDAWLSGDALDVGSMLHTAGGKPRVSVFSIGHLNDAERMFFVSLLLNEILGWMRTQSGTSTLRAVVYMDEIFGYLPPVANPPSKQPLLTLLKQARAFGVGLVLATQNPVDLDYKALANTGTWFIGRLQTERDKARVIEGLEGLAEARTQFDRAELEKLLSSLGNRIFLLNNVHEDRPEVFETRWAMSYLRGPLTRAQIRILRESQTPQPASGGTPDQERVSMPLPPSVRGEGSDQPPIIPPDVQQVFIPMRGQVSGGRRLVYHPMLLAFASTRFESGKAGVSLSEDMALSTHITEDPVPVSWDHAIRLDISSSDLVTSPVDGALFQVLPREAAIAKNYKSWARELSAWIYANKKIELFRHPGTQEFSGPGESERDFRIRLQEYARQQRDQKKERLRSKYAPKLTTLQERIRRAEQAVEREQEQAREQGLNTVVSVGATLLGALLGRKVVSSTNIGRAASTARRAGRVLKEREDIRRASETTEALRTQLSALEAEFASEMAEIETSVDALSDPLEIHTISPKKSHISVKLVTLAWSPYWTDPDGNATPAWE